MVRSGGRWGVVALCAATLLVTVAIVSLSGVAVPAMESGDAGAAASPADPTANVSLPEGFRISVFSNGDLGGDLVEPHGGVNPGARFMAFHEGTLFVAVPGTDDGGGRVVALPDEDGDGTADRHVTVVDGLDRPNSIAFHDGRLYVAETFAVVRYDMDGLRAVNGSREVVVDDLAESNAKSAWTTTILIENDSLWISKGTAVKSDRPHDEGFREKITRCSLDGEDCETVATGLRNAVGMTFTPAGELVVTEMGMGHTDPDFPPDELNAIERGADYGWPYCHADNEPIDPAFVEGEDNHHRDLLDASDVDCAAKTPPTMSIPAHSSPLGLTTYTGDAFPVEYRGDLFVAYHGSWSLDPPIGYELVRVECEGSDRFEADCGGDYAVHDFAAGWRNVERPDRPHGRPVDVVQGPDGALYVSDDQNGVVYRIWYAGSGEERDGDGDGDGGRRDI